MFCQLFRYASISIRWLRGGARRMVCLFISPLIKFQSAGSAEEPDGRGRRMSKTKWISIRWLRGGARHPLLVIGACTRNFNPLAPRRSQTS
mgnify:CR=1 FL=1